MPKLMIMVLLTLMGASARAQDKDADFEQIYSQFVVGEAASHDDPAVAATYAALEQSLRLSLKRELTAAERGEISQKVAAAFASQLGVDKVGAKRVFREEMFKLLSPEDMHLAATLLASPQGLRIRQAVSQAGHAMDAYLAAEQDFPSVSVTLATPQSLETAPAAPNTPTSPQASESASSEVVAVNMRINARPGRYQEYSEEFVREPDDPHSLLMDVEFVHLQPGDPWVPTFALCVYGEDVHTKDCVRISHQKAAEHLDADLIRIRPSSAGPKPPTILLPSNLPVESRFRISASVSADNVMVFRSNGADLLKYPLDFTPSHYSYACSSMTCDIRFLRTGPDSPL